MSAKQMRAQLDTIIRLYKARQSVAEIARQTGLDCRTVERILASPSVRARVASQAPQAQEATAS